MLLGLKTQKTDDEVLEQLSEVFSVEAGFKLFPYGVQMGQNGGALEREAKYVDWVQDEVGNEDEIRTFFVQGRREVTDEQKLVLNKI